jgi:hypothetical protein
MMLTRLRKGGWMRAFEVARVNQKDTNHQPEVSTGVQAAPAAPLSEGSELDSLLGIEQSPLSVSMGEGAELAGSPSFAWSSTNRGAPDQVIDQVAESAGFEAASRSFAGDSVHLSSQPTAAQLLVENAQLRQEVEALRTGRESLERALESTRKRVDLLHEEDRILADFETGSLIQRHPRVIADQAVQTAHQLCRTPSLFFSIDSNRSVAVLAAEAGFSEGGRHAPASLEFNLDAEAASAIAKITQEGSIASLSEYEPLARLMITTFGVSHFEAWAVTGYSWLGRAAAKPRVLGVLVLMQSGSQTLTRHRSLGRMVRNAGLVYENALLSQ